MLTVIGFKGGHDLVHLSGVEVAQEAESIVENLNHILLLLVDGNY